MFACRTNATGRGFLISASASSVVLHWDCAFSACRLSCTLVHKHTRQHTMKSAGGRRRLWSFRGGVGGGGRNRTGGHGVAGRCITTLPPRPGYRRKLKGRAVTSALPWGIWSGKRVSNSRPQPWQGCALPTELFPQDSLELYRKSPN